MTENAHCLALCAFSAWDQACRADLHLYLNLFVNKKQDIHYSMTYDSIGHKALTLAHT